MTLLYTVCRFNFLSSTRDSFAKGGFLVNKTTNDALLMQIISSPE